MFHLTDRTKKKDMVLAFRTMTAKREAMINTAEEVQRTTGGKPPQ